MSYAVVEEYVEAGEAVRSVEHTFATEEAAVDFLVTVLRSAVARGYHSEQGYFWTTGKSGPADRRFRFASPIGSNGHARAMAAAGTGG